MASPSTLALLKDLSKKNGNNVGILVSVWFITVWAGVGSGLFRVRCTKPTVGFRDLWHLHMFTMLREA